MKVLDLAQGSLDWLEWRLAGIGASDAPIILGLSKWCDRATLLHRKVESLRARGRGQGVNHGTPNGACRRGNILEPIAREKYQARTGLLFPPLCCISDDYEWMRASLDGWNSENGIFLELKAPNWRDHTVALEGVVPLHYQAQVQHQMAVTKASEGRYVSYSDNPRFADGKELAEVIVKPSDEYREMLLRHEKAFWDEVLLMLKEE